MMNERLIYIALFIYVLCINIFGIYTDYRMNQVEFYEPSSPIWLSFILWVSNLLVLMAAFGAAFKKYVYINYEFWCAVLMIDIIAAILASYYDFTAGGYTTDEMVMTSLVAVVMVSFYLVAPLKYCQDIKLMEGR